MNAGGTQWMFEPAHERLCLVTLSGLVDGALIFNC